MKIPVEISLRDVEGERKLEALVREKARGLERFHRHISSCRVAIERVRHRDSADDPHMVRLDITVPHGNELIVVEKSRSDEREDPESLVRRAFDTAKRRLKELKDRQRGEVKSHEEPRALVARIDHGGDYGFIRALDGREIYFHRNSVLDGKFDVLEPGTEVRFEEEMGDKGLQATTVQLVSKPARG